MHVGTAHKRFNTCIFVVSSSNFYYCFPEHVLWSSRETFLHKNHLLPPLLRVCLVFINRNFANTSSSHEHIPCLSCFLLHKQTLSPSFPLSCSPTLDITHFRSSIPFPLSGVSHYPSPSNVPFQKHFHNLHPLMLCLHFSHIAHSHRQCHTGLSSHTRFHAYSHGIQL